MAEANNGPARGQQNPAQGFDLKNLLFYGIIALTVINAFGAMQPQVEKNPSVPLNSDEQGQTSPSARNPGRSASPSAGRRLVPLANPGDDLSIRVIVDEGLFAPVNFKGLVFDQTALASTKPSKTVVMNMTECAAKNCSADVHVMWQLRGKWFTASAPLIRFYGTRQVGKHHLIGGKKEAEENSDTGTHSDDIVYRAYLLPSLTVSPVVDFTTPLPPQLEPFATVDDDTHTYGPIVYINDFWVIRDHLRELNATTATQLFPLEINVVPLAMWKLLMYKQFEASMKSQAEMGLLGEDTADETKRIFIETNPYFLALTGLVTLLHMLFEYLAFANDIKFWRGRKDFKGLSLRSIAINCYFQTIIFLYLADSNETSWTILLPSAFGVLAEYWKLTQCVVVRKRATAKEGGKDEQKSAGFAISVFGYDVSFSDSYDKRTRSHDDTAIRWLMYIMIPILIGYSVYSAVYNEHKSWYSYLIHTQVQFIYFFGFAMMTPQIFINYKLKSVGQLPWRTFVYKALNTVIDDLFAFIIKMPWLHRIACFRDDVVFVILLYQRWIYPVDMSRMADDDNPLEADESAQEHDVVHQPSQHPAGTEEIEGKKQQ